MKETVTKTGGTTMKRKFILAMVLVVIGLFAALPTVAGAATGAVTIDVSTLGGTSLGNSAFVATESQWRYNDTQKTLFLDTADGNYTLTGTNANLCIIIPVTATNANVTLNAVNITPASGGFAFTQNADDCTITLVGGNIFTFNNDTMGFRLGNSLNSTITSVSGGSLTTPSTQLLNDSILKITGNAAISSFGTNSYWGINVQTRYNILLGNNAKFSFGNDVSSEARTIQQADAGDTHKWKLTNATTAGNLTDVSILVLVAANQTGTIERERIPVPPTITTTTLPGGTVSKAYSQALAATGDTPLTWTLSDGNLPDGLALSSAGVITGTPTKAGTFNFTVTAANGVSPNDAKAFTIIIAAAPVIPDAKIPLPKPTGLKLAAKKVTWKKVANNSGYTLKIMKGKKVIATKQIGKDKTSYKFPKSVTKLFKKGTKYTVTLVAKGTGTYLNSPAAKSKAVKLKK